MLIPSSDRTCQWIRAAAALPTDLRYVAPIVTRTRTHMHAMLVHMSNEFTAHVCTARSGLDTRMAPPGAKEAPSPTPPAATLSTVSYKNQ